MLTNADLWARLRKLQLDDPAAILPFSKRLARDNGWTHAFALRTIEEYRRFAYLAMVAGREVTPSDEVDQVWHLHLTYTPHYWGPFTDMLGAPLHHGPTSGGAAENARYEKKYEFTKRLYRTEFGMDPPADIWPCAAKRFGDAPYFRRFNTKNYWRIPKPKAAGAIAGLALAAIATVFANVALAGKGADRSAAPGWLNTGLSLEVVLALALALVLVAAVLISARRARSKRRKDNKNGYGGGVGAGCGSGKSDGNGGDGGGGCGGGCGGCGG